ncbi:MAG: glycosyltransferase family 4 protein [Actinomycetota bacterium]|nr:glycosyltransferase family 4 protein [Actinomycetota bacterium]
MTRIALVPSSYLPALGGVEELTRHLARTLREAGDEVEVWTGTSDDRDPPSRQVLDGITVRRFPLPLPAARPGPLTRSGPGALRALRALGRAVDEFRPQVLHVQCFGPNGAYAAALGAWRRLPVVVTLQGETVMDDADIFERSTVLRASLRSALRHAAVVTACSAFTLADAEDRFGLAAGRGRVVFNGVDLAAPPAGRWRRAPAAPYVLAVGRVVEKKGFDLLLAAYAAVSPAARTADLVVAGDGAERERLGALATSLGIADRVHFPGRLDRDDVAAAMAGAELFVMPSRLEPFGIVVLEAWRAGVAVLATGRGGPPEFVTDGVDGVLVDPTDPSRFAELLAGLLADPARRARLAAAGRARVEDFAWQVIAGRYRECYRDALARA